MVRAQAATEMASSSSHTAEHGHRRGLVVAEERSGGTQKVQPRWVEPSAHAICPGVRHPMCEPVQDADSLQVLDVSGPESP